MRFLLLSAILLASFYPSAELNAQVPNGGFEAWFTVPSTTIIFPEYWTLSISPAVQHVTQTPTSYAGQFAVRGEVGQAPPPLNYFVPILESIATFGPGSSAPPEPGFPQTQHESAVSGYYMFSPIGDDELITSVELIDWADTSVVGFGVATLPASSTYAPFAVGITQVKSDPPTHCWIKFTITSPTAGAHVGSVFYLDEISFSTGTAVEPEGRQNPLTVFPNYPNPFDRSTEIEFLVPRTSFVQVAVLDLLGRRVHEFPQVNLPPGRHSVTWDASGMPAGVYLYRIDVGGTPTTRAMLLIK